MKKEGLFVIFFTLIFLSILYLGSAVTFENPSPNNSSYLETGSSALINFSSDLQGNSFSFLDFNRDLVLNMRMDEANTTTVFDTSSWSNNGTIAGDVALNSTGYFGNASHFDGAGDHINITSNLGLKNSNVTISAWAYLKSSSEKGPFVKIGGDGTTGFGIGVGESTFDNPGNDLIVIFEAVRWIDTDTTIGTGWHQVALVLNTTGSPELYIDGSIVSGSFTGSNAPNPAQQTVIGGYYNSGASRYFNGSIDEVLIWNRSLSSSEISSLYNSSVTQYSKNFSDLGIANYTIKAYSVNGSNVSSLDREFYVTDDVPESSIEINISLYPGLQNFSVEKYDTFQISVNVSCVTGSCGAINVSLDPTIGSYNFTTCGKSGRDGPNQSDCDINYSGANLAGEVTLINGTQYWTVPSTGDYMIEVGGAQGGNGSGTTYVGGFGARMTGNFSLSSGDQLKIIVGQQGGNRTSYKAGGGGGGSFVAYSNNTPIIVAGGGSGGGGNSNAGNGQPGLNETTGGTGSIGVYEGGTLGKGGGANGGSSGGGGFLTDGNVSSCVHVGEAGLAFINNGTGGDPGICAAGGGFGGFGGGSGGEWCCMGAAGAGGGYSGGGGTNNNGVPGGGGSYNSGDDQINIQNVTEGDGYVRITSLSAKSGLVSTTVGTDPFWTSTTNPYNISLNEGESEIITWTVNATGAVSDYTFFAYVNTTSGANYSNISETWIVSINDSVSPSVNLNSPANGTKLGFSPYYLNASFNDNEALRNATFYMWNDTELVNTTYNSLSGGNGSINLSVSFPHNGNFSWNYYTCDTSSNCAFASNNLSLEYAPPTLSIDMVYPTENINVYKGEWFNVTLNISCSNSNCGTVNVSLDPAITLTDNKSFQYDIQDGCDMSDGQSDVFDGGLKLYIDNSEYTGSRFGLEDDDREAICAGQNKSGLNVSRKVYVPSDENWARYLEILENPTGEEICTEVRIYQNMGSDGSDYMNTSDGNISWEITDNWMMWDDSSSTSGDDAAAFIYQHEGGQEMINYTSPKTASGGQNEWRWQDFCIPAGQTRVLMHFFTQMDTRLQSETEAINIYDNINEGKYRSGMSGNEEVQVSNLEFGKGGLISMDNNATPFWTNVTNPYNLTLNEGESQIITWTVNATGSVNNTYLFFAFANATDDESINVLGDEWNVTIINETIFDTNIPEVNITYPGNESYNKNISIINYTYVDGNQGQCWYTTDLGVTNSTNITAGMNFSEVASSDGSNTWTVYCNDTWGNIGNQTVTFSRDLPILTINVTNPIGNYNATRNLFFEVTAEVSCSNANCGEVNVTLDPEQSVQYNFTTCGQTGRTGPSESDCNSNYNGTSLEDLVNVTNGIQNWTVPETGSYRIEAYGAQGGDGGSYASNNIGGYGAKMTGNFELTAGETLWILVGQEGGSHATYGGAGGGGSFVANGTNYASSSPLVVAGGGGGAGQVAPDNSNASTSTSGGAGGGNSPGAGGTDGNGGVSDTSYGGGGGGFYGNGTAGNSVGRGTAFISGGVGGSQRAGGIPGFGGGAAAHGGAGGGGGYSGGGGGDWSYAGWGGGAGSYNAGAEQENSEGYNSGDGFVVITRLSSAKGGVIPRNISSTPFYTNVTNPYNLTLNEGESETITWTVNATGGLGESYPFFVIVNRTSDVENGAISAIWNVTIVNASTVDTTSPSISISNPVDGGNYSDENLNITFLVTDDFSEVGQCWYSNDSYTLNTSLGNCNSANITGVSWSEGQHNVTIWANDSEDNVGSQSLEFIIDLTNPGISISNPSDNANVSNGSINYVASDSYLNSCWYSNDTHTVNVTLESCNNITGVSWSEGQHNVTIWANDSAGNMNQSSLIFYFDSIAPNITSIGNNNTFTNNSEFNFTINVSDSTSGVSNVTISIYNESGLFASIFQNIGGLGSATFGTVVTLGEGIYNWFWSAVDIVSNEQRSDTQEDIGANYTITYDASVSSISFISPTNNSNTSDSTPLIRFNITDNLSEHINYSIYVDDTVVNHSGDGFSANSIEESVVISTALSLGEHNISIWANDSAGNIVFSEYLVLTIVPPAVNLQIPQYNQTINYQNLSFVYEVEDPTSSYLNCSIYLDDVINQTENVAQGTSNNFTIPNLGDAEYDWSVSCINAFDTEANDSAIFTIDSVNPIVNITDPTNNTFSNDAGLDLKYHIIDTSEVDSCWYTESSLDENLSLAGCGNITSNLWEEGQHNITIWANDSAGNVGTSTVRFTIDFLGASLNIVSPSSEQVSSDTGLNVNFTLSDYSPIVGCWYSNDTHTVNVTLESCNNITGVSWSEGQHNVTIWANDSAGNLRSSSIQFSIDNTSPYFERDTLDTDIPYLESLGVEFFGVDETEFGDYIVNWSDFFEINASGYLTNKTTLASGSYNVNITINDSVGNENSTTHAITVSGLISVLNITFNPSENETYGTGVNITGIGCPEELTCVLYRNDSSVTNSLNVTLGAGSYNYTYNTTGNSNYSSSLATRILTINRATSILNLTLNGSESNISFVAGEEILINGTLGVGDSSGTIRLYNNGTLINEGTGEVSNVTNFSGIGSYNITVEYVESENYTSSSKMYYVDAASPGPDVNPPTVNITYPVTPGYNYIASVINYTASDPNLDACWYSIDSGVTNTSVACGTNVSSLTSVEGSNTWTVWANDTEGNVGNKSVTFTIDLGTSISITYPGNTSYALNISGLNYTNSEDNAGSCWYSIDSGETNSSSVSSGTNFTDISSSEGSNTWTVYCNDTVGNLNSSSITFFKDTVIPEVTIDSPENITYLSLPIRFNVSINEAGSVEYSLDSGINNFSMSGNESNTGFNATNNSLANTNYTLWIYAQDQVGNLNNTVFRNFTSYGLDADGDGIIDVNDTVKGNETSIPKAGFGDLNLTIGGNSSNGTFLGMEQVVIEESSKRIMNFSFNFSAGDLDFTKITLIKSDTGVLVNVSGQLQTNKTVFIDDNSFIGLCVKDAELASLSDVSSSCDAAGELDFDSCLGSNLSLEGIDCIDLGDRIRFDNLRHSAIVGEQAAPPSEEVEDGGSSIVGSASGAGGYCTNYWACTAWSYCTSEVIQTRTCEVKYDNNCEPTSAKPDEIRVCPDILFDVSLKLEKSKIWPWDPLEFSVDLMEVNRSELADIEVVYNVYSGSRIVYTESETLAIEGQHRIEKSIENLDLDAGNYELEVILKYGKNQSASSRAQFSLMSEKSFKNYILIGIIVLLLLWIGYNEYRIRKDQDAILAYVRRHGKMGKIRHRIHRYSAPARFGFKITGLKAISKGIVKVWKGLGRRMKRGYKPIEKFGADTYESSIKSMEKAEKKVEKSLGKASDKINKGFDINKWYDSW